MRYSNQVNGSNKLINSIQIKDMYNVLYLLQYNNNQNIHIFPDLYSIVNGGNIVFQ